MSYLIVNAARSAGTIRKTIYGQFSEHLGRCIYGGIADQDGALRPAVLQALKTLHIPVLRWPGGCFADTYHWRDGIGPRSERKTIINTNWGGVTENNAFGTHEFLSLCEQLGCEAYLSGNVGSGTVQEFSDWVEYCNMPGVSPMADLRRRNGREAPFGVRYWGIGNEAWGCGGTMRAEYYADLCRQYATYLRSYDAGLVPYKIASGANVDDYHWTRTVVERAGQCIDAVSLHYYTVPGPDWQHKGSATDFDRDAYYTTLHKTLRMEELVENHSRIIRRFAKGRPIGLCVDEWGTWYDVEPGTNPGFLYQQNTMRDALVAAVNLNIFNNHCDTVVMANIAQLVNVLQAMLLTEGDKVEVQARLGWQVNTWAVGDLVQVMNEVTDAEIDALMEVYRASYDFATDDIGAIRYQAREEIAIKKMLDAEGCQAFSNTFQDLYGMEQLPGLASQHLMAQGYGYGGEGDWKVAAMTAILKAMGENGNGASAFMEDYTYHLVKGQEYSLGAHMLEVCPSVAAGRPRIETHFLGIGMNEKDPARLVFEGKPGKAVVVSLIDMGGRLRLIVQDIEAVKPIMPMPNLPVARVMWRAMPDLTTGVECWITAGGAHHTVLSYDVTAEQLRDWARMMEIEFVHITKDTTVESLEHELFLNDLAWKLK